jgi:hypothetical protein
MEAARRWRVRLASSGSYAATSANDATVIPVTLLGEGGPFCTPIGGSFWDAD